MVKYYLCTNKILKHCISYYYLQEEFVHTSIKTV